MKYTETASRVELDAVCQWRDTAHGRGTPLSVQAYRHLSKGPTQILCRCVSLRQRRFTWQRKCLRFRTRTRTPRGGWEVVWGQYLWCNAVLQGALWHTGDREWGDVHGNMLGAHGEHGLFSLRKTTQDIDSVSVQTSPSAAASHTGQGEGRLMTQVKHGETFL